MYFWPTCLSAFGTNCYKLFAPDLMHEFELGIWKAVFAHLMHILAEQGPDQVAEYNRRMRAMPTFGHDRIRRFWNDASAQKRLATCDYEAFLMKPEKVNAKCDLLEAIDRGLNHATNCHQGDIPMPVSATTHYEVSTSQHAPVNLYSLLEDHCGDPALKDSINPQTHPNIMLLANDPGPDSHLYCSLYRARIKPRNVEVATPQICLGPLARIRRLPRVRFINSYDATDNFTLGFINPDDIIRAAYLMPVFVLGRTDEFLGPSKLARQMSSDEDDDDYCVFYVCMWIDRDMYMRYHGDGISHRGVGVTLEQSRKHSARSTRSCLKQPAKTKGKQVARALSPNHDAEVDADAEEAEPGDLDNDNDHYDANFDSCLEGADNPDDGDIEPVDEADGRWYHHHWRVVGSGQC
ncbi:hypothetical protein C8Q80DRAFT_1124073 [Daedaleopsis nitida]|nr:hypothetical protein C8Q80DRAFT_1124073 [Daedaleopsis nitida]